MRIVSRFAFALLVTASACHTDAIAGSSKAAVGTWSLSSYNGLPLPATAIQQGTTTVAVVSGSIDLEEKGTFHILTSYRTTQNGAATMSSQDIVGIWVDRGGTITMVPDGGAASVVATYKGNQLTFAGVASDGSTLPFVYTR
ncbi:MAG: hypothetical protein ABIY52_15520 [Gemmatimonadaceae bacterium]